MGGHEENGKLLKSNEMKFINLTRTDFIKLFKLVEITYLRRILES